MMVYDSIVYPIKNAGFDAEMGILDGKRENLKAES